MLGELDGRRLFTATRMCESYNLLMQTCTLRCPWSCSESTVITNGDSGYVRLIFLHPFQTYQHFLGMSWVRVIAYPVLSRQQWWPGHILRVRIRVNLGARACASNTHLDAFAFSVLAGYHILCQNPDRISSAGCVGSP